LEATEANFGPEAREEVAKAVVDEDINDLFGEAEQAPVSDPQAEPPQFWGVPHAWVKRLVERANEVTDGYYRHLMHAENTLKREGFTQVTRANITQALQTLIVHAQKRMAERNRTEAPTDQPPQEQPPLLPDEEPEDHMTPDEPTDA
jgi:hypothetical protein